MQKWSAGVMEIFADELTVRSRMTHKLRYTVVHQHIYHSKGLNIPGQRRAALNSSLAQSTAAHTVCQTIGVERGILETHHRKYESLSV
jgi:hypothetical protein